MTLLPCLARLSLRSAPVGMRGVDWNNPHAVAYYGVRGDDASDDGSDQGVTVEKELTAQEVAAEKYENAKRDNRVIDLLSDDESSPHPRKLAKVDDLEGLKAEYAEQRRLAGAHTLLAKRLIEADAVDQLVMALRDAKEAAAEMQRLQARMDEENGDWPAAVMVPARTGKRLKQMAHKAVAAAAGPPSSSSVPTGIRTLAPTRAP